MAVVETERHGQIFIVRMNRPERLNALNTEMRTVLAETWTTFRQDDDLEVAEAPAPSPSHLCYVCCVSRKNAVIMECGHGGIGFECGKSLASRHPRNCPICRAPISAVLRVERREPGSPHVFSPEGVVVQPRRS